MKLKNLFGIVFYCSTMLGMQCIQHHHGYPCGSTEFNPSININMPITSNMTSVFENISKRSGLFHIPSKAIQRDFISEKQTSWMENINKKSFFDQIKDLISNNKYKIVALGLASTYCYALYQIVSGNNYLTKKDLWSSWKKECRTEQLLAIPLQQIAEQLELEIHKRYTNASNSIEKKSPIIEFIQETELELTMLRFYKKLYSYISKLHLLKIFPIDLEKFKSLGDRINRLLYLRNDFLSQTTK